MPLGAMTWAPALACATAVDAYLSSVESLSTAPAGVTMPQCPWSVYSHRHRSAVTTRSSPTSALMSESASCEMPSGSSAALPRLSLSAGTPNTMMPPTPASAASAAALRRLSLVCCTTPGIDPIGCGSMMPSLMNTGSTSSAGRSAVSATIDRSALVPRSRRALTSGNPALTSTPSLADPAAAAAAALARTSQRLARRECRVALRRTELGERVDEGGDRRLGRRHVHPQPEVGGGLGRLRADHPDHGDRVRLARDAHQVPHGGRRREQDRVEPAALDRFPDRGGRRRGAHRPVRGHVLSFPAQFGQPG